MNIVCRGFVALCAACLVADLAIAAEPHSKAAKSKPYKVRLHPVKLKAGQLRPGYEITVPLPKTAMAGTLEKTKFYFLDLDGDGTLSTDGKDGLAVEGLPFVVPLPRVLLLPIGQGEIAFDGNMMTFTPLDLGIDPELVREASSLTFMRLCAGVSPVTLDPEACRHCQLHLDYLRRNNVTQGMALHKEDPGRPGYTAEGAKAGKNGDMFPVCRGLHEALGWWYPTAWHGAPIVEPTLRKVGVMAKYGMATIYFSASEGSRDRLFCHPADGATCVPTRFGARGEIPNPVPGSNNYGAGCGLPIFIRLPPAMQNQKLLRVEVRVVVMNKRKATTSEPLEGYTSSPLKPANAEWPRNSDLALFIPARPLARRTTYLASFSFEGMEKPIEWKFTTGNQ